MRLISARTLFLAAALALACGAAASGAAEAARSVLPPATIKALRSTKILVVGGSGRNGSAIVSTLEEAGVRPKALTRDVAKARERLGNHDWVQGDVTQPESLQRAFKGIDVVIFAAATRSLDGPNSTEAVDREGSRNVVAAARRAGVHRLLIITGMSIGNIPADGPAPMKKVLNAKLESERLFAASGIPYVLLRPTGILDTPGGVWAVKLADPAVYRPTPEEMAMRQAPADRKPEEGPPAGTVSKYDLAQVAAFAAVDASAANKTMVITSRQPAEAARFDWPAQLAQIPAVDAQQACNDPVFLVVDGDARDAAAFGKAAAQFAKASGSRLLFDVQPRLVVEGKFAAQHVVAALPYACGAAADRAMEQRSWSELVALLQPSPAQRITVFGADPSGVAAANHEGSCQKDAWLIVKGRISDRAQYAKYISAVGDSHILERYGVQREIVMNAPEVQRRNVSAGFDAGEYFEALRFPCMQRISDFGASAEYQQLRELRRGAVVRDVAIFEP